MNTAEKFDTGTKFERLTLLKKVPRPPHIKNRNAWYACVCDCGQFCRANIALLKCGDKKSCGCLYIETRGDQARTHGMSGTPLFKRWKSMMERCYQENKGFYNHYGGRGIKVCKRWHKFINFYHDNKLSFEPHLELDRINNNGDYKPSNCRWATRKQQCNNTRRNHYLTYNNETHTVTEWAELLEIPKQTIFGRLRLGWDVSKILNN